MSDANDKARGPAGPPPLPQHAQPHAPKATDCGGVDMPNLDQTRIIRRRVADEPKTVLVRPSSRSASGEQAKPSDDLPEGPVVGWLVVFEGPGRGKSVALGYGMNPIGREPGNRVCLPFGDMSISRNKHATLTYDPRGRKFFIQHGDSTNLTYVGDQPVLTPLELKSGDFIRLGDNTVLKFIPLCGDDFEWD